MIPFKIGNWLVENDGIKWDGVPKLDYFIAKDQIDNPGPGKRKNKYDWLVHIPEKTWVSIEDAYALNTALIYALEAYNIPIPKKLSFVETIIEQAGILNQK